MLLQLSQLLHTVVNSERFVRISYKAKKDLVGRKISKHLNVKNPV